MQLPSSHPPSAKRAATATGAGPRRRPTRSRRARRPSGATPAAAAARRRALYTCVCGYAFTAPVTTSVGVPPLRHRAGLVAGAGSARAASKRARGIEPPFLAWEASVLTIGQRPRGGRRISRGGRAELAITGIPLMADASSSVLARHRRRRRADRAARLRRRRHGHGHDARRRDARRQAGRRRPTAHAAGARRHGHGLAGRLPGQGRARELLGVVVPALPRRAAAAREDAPATHARRAGPCSAST